MVVRLGILVVLFVSARYCLGQSPTLKQEILEIERDGARRVEVVTSDGIEFIVSVTLSNVDNSDTKILAHAAKLSRVKALILTNSDVSDQGLKSVARFRDLEMLDLANYRKNSRITNAGVEELKVLSKLRHLDLLGAKITDQAGEAIGRIKSLRRLSVSGGDGLSDGFVERLLGLDLESLQITNAKITSRSLVPISKMSQLRELDLSFTDLADENLGELRLLKSLRSLNLAHTKISDLGLEIIGDLPNLKVVNIAETKATVEGISELQEERPDLQIEILAPRTRR